MHLNFRVDVYNLIPVEMDRSSTGLLSCRRTESTLHKGTVQTSQSSGKVGQQEGMPRGYNHVILKRTVCFTVRSLKVFMFPHWLCYIFYVDVTAVCILEAFQNQQSMLLADKVLKQLGKEKAKEKYKVHVSSGSFFIRLPQ